MMTEDDRKRVFWLLRKYSSYTAWKALGDAFQAFTDGWEYAVNHVHPPLDSDDFWVEALKSFWKGCEGFDRGLPLLKQGDRYIFRNKANWLIKHQIKYAYRLMDPVEYVHDWMVNKEEIYNAHLQVEEYKRLFYIAENPDKTLPATFKAKTVFFTDTWPRHLDYSQFNFPSQLPDVPEPTKTIVDSGKEVSVDGIWEPEWLDPSIKQSRVVKLCSLFVPSEPDALQKGCMNYLIAGTTAPLYRDGTDEPAIPVRWRLIWQDTRYLDGTIPDEEKEYLESAPERQRDELDSSVLRATAGEECPRAGYWQSQDGKTETRFYMERESFADLDSGYGLTIWQYVGKSRRTE